MKKNIHRFQCLVLALVLCFNGCSTTSQKSSGITSETSKDGVLVKDFVATRASGALFVKGSLLNRSGGAVSNMRIEARGYDKNNNLVSTDEVNLSPSQIKNKQKVKFSITFTSNVNEIDTYYLLGRYEDVRKKTDVQWRKIGAVILVVAVVTAVALATAYGEPGVYGPTSPQAVYVNGYYQRDGTYIRPYYRAAPDAYILNNFGPSQTDQELLSPDMRDFDGDGIPNYRDRDDDNDGIPDDQDSNPYGI